MRLFVLLSKRERERETHLGRFRAAQQFRIALNNRFGKQKVVIRHEVRYDDIQPAATWSLLADPRENRLPTERHQVPLQGTTEMLYDVGRVGCEEALRHESDVQGPALQLDVQEVDQLVHADGVGPDGAPEARRPQIRVVVRVNVPVDHEHLIPLEDQPLQRDVVEPRRDRAHFPAEDLIDPLYETMMIFVGERIEVLKIQNDDLVRVRGEPVRDVHQRLANL